MTPHQLTPTEKLAQLIDEKNSIMKRQICDIEDPNLTDDEEANKEVNTRT